MATGPNQILLKRSDSPGVVPSGLSFGEPAINTADGKLFFQEHVNGSATNNMLAFHGFTNENFVTSLNGLTGAALINAGTNITLTTGAGGITVDAFGAGSNVTSFNGATGAVQGVGSFAGFTGAVAEGVTTNQVLFHTNAGITGSNDFLWEANVNHPHAEVDIEGKLLKAIKADEALAALDPVYITGNVGASDRVTVAKADASDPAKMPAAGIVTHSFSTNDEGYMVVTGLVREANTSGYSANDTAYVAAGGGITAARPSGTNDLIQNLGRVGRVHASTGTLLVLGAGRANDVPNLLHARSGLSCDSGATFAGVIDSTSGISVGGSTIGGVKLATGVVTATLFSGTATTALSANSATSATTATNVTVTAVNDSVQYHIPFAAGAAAGTAALGLKSDGGTTHDGIYFQPDIAHFTTGTAVLSGISLGANGITFNDGTFQSTAAGLTHTDENFTVADHTKLDGIEASADVTDATNVTAAGALMDSELTSIADVKALNQSVVSGANPVFTSISALAGISVGAGGVTFSDGSNQTVAFDPTSAVSLSGGDTSTPSLTITADDNGTNAAPIIDLIRDPADDGNGANGDYLGQIKFKGQSNSGTERVYAKITGKIGSATNGDEDGVVEHMVQRDGSSQIVFRTKKTGILLNEDSGTPMQLEFSDGTSINTALRTDSYTGQIETVADKTYTLDPKVATARTITGFYIKSASGTVTATLKNGSDTIKAASVSSSSGDQTSLANTSVAADAVLTLVTSSNSSALDVIFNIEYTS